MIGISEEKGEEEGELTSLLSRNKPNTQSNTSITPSLLFFTLIFISQILIIICIIIIIVLYLSVSRDYKFRVYEEKMYQEMINPVYNGSRSGKYWIGGDGSMSVLIDGVSVWLYGDSVFGRIDREGFRVNGNLSMVNNMMGVRKGNRIMFYFNRTGFESFFVSRNKSVHFWNMQGLNIKNESSINENNLFVFTPRVINAKNDSFDLIGFGFNKCVFSNLDVTNPYNWDCDYKDIEIRKTSIQWGYVGNIIINNHIYFFGNSDELKEMILLRIKIKDILNNDLDKLEYWSGKWSEDKTSKLVGIKNLPKDAETSINYSKYMKKYYTFRVEHFKIYIYLSDKIEGPYERDFIYDVPSPFSTTKNVIVYGIKSHPELERSQKEMIITYNTNSWPPSKFKEMFFKKKLKNLCIPQYLRIEIRKNQIFL